MTPQARLKAKLEQLAIPFVEIACYGSQITVECASHDTARKWVSTLQQFATYRGTVETVKDLKENRGTCLLPTKRKIWRVYAAV